MAMFGDFLSPQPTVGSSADPGLVEQWQSVLQKPEVRAGLLSFGLQAMTGGWGGLGQQFAQAAGSGMEAYTGSLKLQADADLAERTANEARTEKERERQLRRELNAEDNAAALTRTKLTASAGKESQRDQLFWDRAVNSRVTQLQKENAAKLKAYEEAKLFNPDTPVPELMTDEQMLETAYKWADEMAVRRGVRTGRAAPGQKNEGNIGDSPMPGGLPPSGQTGAVEPPSDAVNTNAAVVSGSKEYDLAKPENKAAWNDPVKRAKLEALGYSEVGGKIVKGASPTASTPQSADVPPGGQLIQDGLLFRLYRMPDGSTKSVLKNPATDNSLYQVGKSGVQYFLGN